jgi:hypothetical protein
MGARISKALIASLAALTLAASVLPVNEAAAAPYRDNWDNGWWYGWQGRAGGSFGYGGAGWGGPTIMGEPTYEAPYYAYRGACTTAYQPVYDAYGEYVGQQVVSVC